MTLTLDGRRMVDVIADGPEEDRYLRTIAAHTSAYITHVRRQLRHTLPKAIVHCLVRIHCSPTIICSSGSMPLSFVSQLLGLYTWISAIMFNQVFCRLLYCGAFDENHFVEPLSTAVEQMCFACKRLFCAVFIVWSLM